MNPKEMVTCDCIVAHPDKPKFMVVQHKGDKWLLPFVRFPAEGLVGDNPQPVTEAVEKRYGMKATLLRQVFQSPNYQCIELELHAVNPAKPLRAVWMGRKEFLHYRAGKPKRDDPLMNWLEQARRSVPSQRAPWERPGWFRRASTWIEHELDRQGIQVVGSVRQYRVFRPASVLLRAKTAEGYCYFKAGKTPPPGEAGLTVRLAERWPELVPMPMAVDPERDWMLMRDYRPQEELNPSGEEVVRSFANLQVESSQEPDSWTAHGCRRLGLAELADFLGSIGRLEQFLRSGNKTLSREEYGQLLRATEGLRLRAESLGEMDIPDALVHADFRMENVFARPGGHWLVDWSNTTIGHPFLSLAEWLIWRDARAMKYVDPAVAVGKEEELVAAYLEPFQAFASADDLQRGLGLAVDLVQAWRAQMRWEQLALLEPGSIAYNRLRGTIIRACRAMMAAAG